MENFKLFGGESINNIVDYIKEYLLINPKVHVCIGTDSRRSKKKTLFATVVCFRHDNNGVHVVFKRKAVSGKMDLYSRLWHETELTTELALAIKDVDNINLIIDVDYNPDKNAGSNIVHDAAVGYLTGLGFQVRSKPYAWAATYAADLLCK